jgi:hypothetical protein
MNQFVTPACDKGPLLVVQNLETYWVVTQHWHCSPKKSNPVVHFPTEVVAVARPPVQVSPRQVEVEAVASGWVVRVLKHLAQLEMLEGQPAQV